MFRLVILFLIVYTSSKDMSISLLVSIGFIVSLQTLTRQNTEDEIVNNIAMQLPPMTDSESEQIETEELPEPEFEPEDEPVPDDIPQQVVEPVPDDIPQQVVEPVPDDIPQQVVEPVSDDIPQQVVEPVSDDIPQQVVEPVSDDIPQQVVEPVSDDIPQQVVEPVSDDIPQQVVESEIEVDSETFPKPIDLEEGSSLSNKDDLLPNDLLIPPKIEVKQKDILQNVMPYDGNDFALTN